MWILSRISGDDDKSQQAEFLVRGRDIDADDKRTLKWNDETSMHEVIGDTESFLLSPERRDILKLLETGLHYRPQDIADAIGKSRQNTHKMLTRLKAAGMVKQDSVGKYFCVKNKTIPVGYDDTPPVIDAVPAVAPITPPQEPLPTISMLSMLPEHKIAEMRVLAKSDAQEDHYALSKMLSAMSIIGDMQKRVVSELCN
jgi:predicted transcriptional regulator